MILGSVVNGTPVFDIVAEDPALVSRVYGAVSTKTGWRCPAYYPLGAAAYKDLRTLFPRAEWDSAAQALVAELRTSAALWFAAKEAYEKAERVPLPVSDEFFDPQYPPFAHQRWGIARSLSCYRAFFLWDMGTGKTRTLVEVFRILRELGKFKRALVFAPPIVMPTWVRETKRWSAGGLKAVVWEGGADSLAEASAADVVVASYARARLESARAAKNKTLSRLLQLDYDVIVADESHSLGNVKSQQTKALLELSAKAARRYALSGTAADTPMKLYAQLRFLAPALLPLDWTSFLKRYVEWSPYIEHAIVGYKNLGELNARTDIVAIRAKKAECLTLPPVLTTDVYYALGVKQRARYNELVVAAQASITPLLDYAKSPDDALPAEREEVMLRLPHGAARVMKLQQVLSGFIRDSLNLSVCDSCSHMATCVPEKIKPYSRRCKVYPVKPALPIYRDVENPKLEAFEALLETILDSDPTNKVLCWASFTPELDDLEAVCKRRGWGHIRIDGNTTKHIAALEDKLQKEPACRVSLGQVRSGVGITLTAANYTVYYALPWDPVAYKQSIDRNNRPGQTRSMTVYRLLADPKYGALDTFIAYTLSFKDQLAYTLTEKVACGPCLDKPRCMSEGNRPFGKGCKYQSTVTRPLAKAEAIYDEADLGEE
jgi:SNF2 family DNA or RNA helicase